jgi:RNA polymerase sigma-70 factor (ECF subfamily)
MWSLAQSGESRLSEASERSVLRAAQTGSEAAVEELFRRHWHPTHRAAYVIVRDAPAAEDIAQEAFLSAIGALDRFDRRRPFAPWLHRIAVNKAIDWSRARTARREVSGEVREAVAPISGGEEERAERDAVSSAIAELDDDQRAVVVLRYLFEYTPGEIASMLELPRGTVNSRLRRALDQLGGALGEEQR